jgi:hypothetical protein
VSEDAWARAPQRSREAKAPSGAVLRVAEFGQVAYAAYGYEAELVSGAWPTDSELVALCHEFFAGQFGGEVLASSSPQRRRVLVNVD